MTQQPKWWWSEKRRQAFEQERISKALVKKERAEKDAQNKFKRRVAAHRACGKYRIVQDSQFVFIVELLSNEGHWRPLDAEGRHIHRNSSQAPYPYQSLEEAHKAGVKASEKLKATVKWELDRRSSFSNIYEPPEYKAAPRHPDENPEKAFIEAVSTVWVKLRAPW